MKVTIVGGGTAGLIAAIVLKKRLPVFDIQIIESSKIGIIGVGEGSTEHWKMFCETCEIDIDELVMECEATHKYGIRYENWTQHTPDYFHSIGEYRVMYDSVPLYEWVNSNKRLLTSYLSNPAFIENCIINPFPLDDDGNEIREGVSPHRNVNQFHFDTFKLNRYLHKICAKLNVSVTDAEISKVNVNPENGNIDSVSDANETYESDFWIDATGFSRLLMSELQNTEWEPYSKYLLTDSASPFPTEADSSGEIRPYTRARAASAGWMWEIPTQTRRGNGYVFSSSHISEDEVLAEIKTMTGISIDNPRFIRYNSGYLKKQWHKNCVTMGLASAFVEPLEATSISTSIQQARLLATFLPTYNKNSVAMPNRYNEIMTDFFGNLVAMIALHYVSDRRDTPFWRDMSEMPKPPSLTRLMELWQERPPARNDMNDAGYNLFQVAHFWHVAQGQGLVSPDLTMLAISNKGAIDSAVTTLKEIRENFLQPKRAIKHHEIFKR